jgi:hypothetical protein
LNWRGVRSASPFSILWPSPYHNQPTGTVAALAAMYQTKPTSEAIFLALCGALEGVLCNLAADYRAEPNDVLVALMLASKRPLVNEDAVKEIAGRIRGALQNTNRKETSRANTLEAFADSGLHPTHTKQSTELRLDLERALQQMKPADRVLLLKAALDGITSEELLDEIQAKSEQSVKARRYVVRKWLKNYLQENEK